MKKEQSKNADKVVKSTEEQLSRLLERKPPRDDSISEALTLYDELSIHQDAVKGSSHLSNFKLKMRMVRHGGELFHRACEGDTEAVSELAVLARNLANELNLLAKHRPVLIREIAKSYDEWPVVLSLIDNNKDGEAWYRFFQETLKLGEDSFCCMNRRQKIDLENIWNRYVWFALKAMRINKVAVPLLLEKCKSLPSIQQSIPVGRTVLQTRFYELPKETVMISEWAALCPNLPAHLTNDDAVIEQFMRPLRLAVLEYWLENPSEYETAKSKVKRGATYKTDLVYRSRCFTQMKQQLRTLAGK
jgi:hypothetical protein